MIDVGTGKVVWSSTGNQVFGIALDRGGNWLAVHRLAGGDQRFDVRIVALNDLSERQVKLPATSDDQNVYRRLKMQFDWS